MLFYYNMEEHKVSSKILLIGGPTGVGKSHIALDVALRINGEIISADSMQFYREINIGTDKVPVHMREKVAHHLIDHISLKDSFDVHSFVNEALLHVRKILQAGKVPLIVGGSGLYLRSLMKGIFPMPEVEAGKQAEVRRYLGEQGLCGLYSLLKKTDPEAAGRIHEKDRKRITRALEVYILTGKNISFWQRQKSENPLAKTGKPVYFILTRNKEVMYNRINRRVDYMFDSGWIDEVEKLKEEGYADMLVYKAPIGYAEILDFLAGRYNLEELKEIVKKKTRRFAKKQLTWFRKEDGKWIEIENEQETADMIMREFMKFDGEGV